MNGTESVETFSVSLFPVDSLYCFFFNPFLNSCDVYSGLCLYLFVCYLYSCFFQKAPLGSSDKSRKNTPFLGFQSSTIQPFVKDLLNIHVANSFSTLNQVLCIFTLHHLVVKIINTSLKDINSCCFMNAQYFYFFLLLDFILVVQICKSTSLIKVPNLLLLK